MVLYASDVYELRMLGEGATYVMPRCLGVGLCGSADGSSEPYLFREFEINIWHEKDHKWMLPNWDRIGMCVRPGRATYRTPRLCGNWLRRRLYTGTSPDSSLRLWVYDYNPSDPPTGEPGIPAAPAAHYDIPLPPIFRLEPTAHYPTLDVAWPSGDVS